MRTRKSIVTQLCCMAMMVTMMAITSGCGTIVGGGVGAGVTYSIMHHNNKMVAEQNAIIQSNLQDRIGIIKEWNDEKQRTIDAERSLFSQALTKMTPAMTQVVTQVSTPAPRTGCRCSGCRRPATPAK